MPKNKFALIEKTDGKSRKRFPINDKSHARNALARLPQAKGLSSEESSMIRNKAERKLYGTSSNSKIDMIKKMRAAKKRMK